MQVELLPRVDPTSSDRLRDESQMHRLPHPIEIVSASFVIHLSEGIAVVLALGVLLMPHDEGHQLMPLLLLCEGAVNGVALCWLLQLVAFVSDSAG